MEALAIAGAFRSLIIPRKPSSKKKKRERRKTKEAYNKKPTERIPKVLKLSKVEDVNKKRRRDTKMKII